MPTYEPLRRPFIIRLTHGGRRRIIAIERHDDITFLITDQGGAINHHLMMQMIRNGEAVFDVDQPLKIKITVDKASLRRVNDLFNQIKDRLSLE